MRGARPAAAGQQMGSGGRGSEEQVPLGRRTALHCGLEVWLQPQAKKMILGQAGKDNDQRASLALGNVASCEEEDTVRVLVDWHERLELESCEPREIADDSVAVDAAKEVCDKVTRSVRAHVKRTDLFGLRLDSLLAEHT